LLVSVSRLLGVDMAGYYTTAGTLVKIRPSYTFLIAKTQRDVALNLSLIP
jgi:hypothetical protein